MYIVDCGLFQINIGTLKGQEIDNTKKETMCHDKNKLFRLVKYWLIVELFSIRLQESKNAIIRFLCVR